MVYRKELKHIERFYLNEKKLKTTLCEMAAFPDNSPALQRKINEFVERNNRRLRELQTLLLLHSLSNSHVIDDLRSASLIKKPYISTPAITPEHYFSNDDKVYISDVLS